MCLRQASPHRLVEKDAAQNGLQKNIARDFDPDAARQVVKGVFAIAEVLQRPVVENLSGGGIGDLELNAVPPERIPA